MKTGILQISRKNHLRFYLPRGNHALTDKDYSGESLVSTEQIQLTASPEEFNLIEVIHLNCSSVRYMSCNIFF